uniref:Ras-like GTP-binding protein Rho1 n=2 Tax=Bursaphelenchus xylophilus TaxID=6326 RepID=A0A1I7SWK3_BURXY
MKKKKEIKVVVVGDGSCGKTSLIIAHSSGQFSEQYIPTAFDDFSVEALVNGKPDMITVSDTAGEEDFSSMRPLSYPDADVFLVCYSVENTDSLKHIQEKWVPEIRHFCPNTPIVIIGNKKDIRDENNRPVVSIEEAEQVARKASGVSLIECSAKTKENVKKVFEMAIKSALAYRNRRSNRVVESIMKLRFVF